MFWQYQFNSTKAAYYYRSLDLQTMLACGNVENVSKPLFVQKIVLLICVIIYTDKMSIYWCMVFACDNVENVGKPLFVQKRALLRCVFMCM